MEIEEKIEIVAQAITALEIADEYSPIGEEFGACAVRLEDLRQELKADKLAMLAEQDAVREEAG